jgi:uncharacterized membrane protein
VDVAPAAVGTSSGLPPHLAGALAYSAWWITGAVFLALERGHPFVRFHARQAVVVFGALWLVGIALVALSLIAAFLSPVVYAVTSALALSTWTVGLAAWAACTVQAARGQQWTVPVLGRLLGRNR